METLRETIRREETFLTACEGEQAARVRASLEMHRRMPNGMMCLVASGQSYENLSEPLAPLGEDM